ncbi:MAG: phage tail protein [Beijerinckiaceae bacterium]|nr:phage tail protein [Beijerinckiaceae bacterium]
MSIFRARGNSTVVTPQYTGLQVQTASSALPIPIVYGVSRLAPNLIWADHFQTFPEYTSQGGKGGGQSVTGYTYSTALIFGISEGPISSIGTIFGPQGKKTLSDFNFSIFNGTTPQSTWGYLTASYPASALAYQGTALVASSSFDLGESASIDSIAFEIYGVLSTSGVVNALDADPALVIADYLTNAQYGVGFPAGSIDATALYGASGGCSYQTYCQASGLAFSPCLTDQEPANTTLARWLQLTNSAAIWSDGRLKIIPYGDAVVTGTLKTGQAVTFQPNTASAYDLDDDDYIYDGSGDPVTISRTDPYSASNVVRLEALDRANQYSPTTMEARDQNAIELYGLRIASTITAHEFCDTAMAAISAQLILQRGLYIRNTYSFRLSWEYCLLEPMDLVTLTDTGLGLDMVPVRIIEIEEDTSGLLTVTAEEFPGAVATATAYPVPTVTNTPINRNVAPAPVNTPVIFEPPSDLTGGSPQIWVGLSGGVSGVADPNWGGATIYVSTDDVTYAEIGTVSSPAKQGILSVAVTAASAIPATSQLNANFTESAALVATVGVNATNPALCLVGGEIIAYSAVSLSGAYTYSLGNLQRGYVGQQSGAHAVGVPVLCLDSAVFHYVFPQNLIGQEIYLKFASFNIFGVAAQDLSTCATYAITPQGSGIFGPVAQSLSQGTALDEGAASLAVTESDTYGFASDPYTDTIDLGLASDNPTMLSVGSGGTGASSAQAARANIGAAASGHNSDIVSLTELGGIGINTAVDTSVNLLSVKSKSVLFDNVGGGVQLIVDKAATSDSGSILYQTGYSTRALAGLLSSDRYRISVSAAGTSFTQALDIDPGTGHVGLAGYTADSNNALGIAGTSFLFTASVDSCRFTFNKAATANDASLTFETGFSARALAGLLGSDGYQLKVSPDGSTFFQVYTVDQTTGNLAIKALVSAASYTVATLPTGVNGALAFASNGLKVGETTGGGTGVIVAFSNGSWRRLSDDSVVVA